MRAFLVTFVCVVLSLAATAAGAATAPGRSAPQPGRIVSVEPSSTTPDILDGTVYSLTRVGDEIVVGGNFTQVQNPNSSATIDRVGVFAFDVNTGRVSTAFDMGLNGKVYKVQAASDGTSVYVGGSFSSAGGRSASNLFRADVATGTLDPDFEPASLNGQVRDLEVVKQRLWVAGKFTHIGGHAQRALGTLDATTGHYDPYFGGVLTGLHNPNASGAVTDVLQISSNPAGTELVAVGNFTSVDGQPRSQIARFDVGESASALSTWNTTLYTQACSRSFDTYMTDVEFSPDGSYFAVSSTGAYGGSGSNSGTSGCDVVARWEDSDDAAARPTWTAYPGGDTTWTIEVTQDVVYAGGHQRWQNNPGAGDRPGPGAVERTGIAALDPVNGLPYSWNPTRARGVGIQDMLATDEGLYVGSDTTLIGPTAGNRYHARVALMPLSSGKALPEIRPYTLPTQVATVGVGGSQLVRRTFDGQTVSGTAGAAHATNRPGWGSSVGAFEVNGELYVAQRDGTLTRRTFDGTDYGPPSVVDAADQLVRQDTWHDTDIPSITSLFYSAGRIYFTRSGQNQLYSRSFEVEDDIVGQQRFTVAGPAGVDYSSMRGAFVAGGSFYYSDSLGRLFRTGWGGVGTATGPSGSPVQVSGPGKDSQAWSSRAMFLQEGAPPPPNDPPTASIHVSCTALSCDFDGTDSSDPDSGHVASYDWDFGDGTEHSTDATVTHTYQTAGDRTVTLTVTDDRGASASVDRVVSPTATASPITFVGVDGTHGNRTRHAVTIPGGTRSGDRMLLFFSANTTQPTYSGPQGWTEIESPSGTGIVGRVYTRIATADDAGTSVAVTSSSYAKDAVSVAVYRGVDSGAPLSATALQNTSTAEHRTPTVVAPAGGGWLVSFWAEKSSTGTAWTLPAGQTQRSTSGTPATSGHMLSLLADSAGTVSQGTRGDLAATADQPGRGLTASILLAPADQTAPSNRSPVARAATPTCTELDCSFDGGASSDPDGDTLAYDWDFGDGKPHGTGPRPTHTYATAGQRTVTLTVTDPDGAHDATTVAADPTSTTDPGPGAGAVEYVAADATTGNRTRHTVTVPASVQPGDRLVLFLTANTTKPTYAGPDGWTQIVSSDGGGVVLRAWTKVAVADDAGSTVAATSTGYAKSNATVAAYRSDAGVPGIAQAESNTENSSGAEHVTPTTTASGDSGWVVSYWSDKSSGTTAWSAPSGVVQRATQAGARSGHIASLLADTDGPVSSGSVGGLTATANSTSSRGADITLVLQP